MQPAASAGPILRVAIAAGKFHGVTSTAMPTGCWSTRIRLAPDGAVITVPEARTASSAYHRKNSAAYAVSPRASGSALPFSSEIRWAISSARSVISSKALRRISARSRGAVAAHDRGGRVGRLHAGHRVVHRAVGDRGDDATGGGVEHVEPAAVGRGALDATHPEIERQVGDGGQREVSHGRAFRGDQ